MYERARADDRDAAFTLYRILRTCSNAKHYWAAYYDGSDTDGDTKAYEAAYAYATLMEQLALTYEISAAKYLDLLGSGQEMIAESLTPEQIVGAKQAAMARIRANKNCCLAR